MKRIMVLIAVFLLIPTASAECLTWQQHDDIVMIANQAGINDTSILVGIFEDICSRSYDRNETDTIIKATNDITDLKMEIVDAKIDGIDYSDVDDRVHNTMQNYTDWFETKIDLNYQREMLAAIYNNTYVNMTPPTINDSDYVRIGDYNSRLEDIEEDVIDNKNKLNNPYSVTGNTAYNPNDNTWMAWLGGIIVVCLIGAFVLNFFGVLKMPKRQAPYAPPTESSYPARAIDEKSTIGNAKRARALEFAKNLKIERLQKDMKECQKIEKKEERETKFTALEKELEELTEDD